MAHKTCLGRKFRWASWRQRNFAAAGLWLTSCTSNRPRWVSCCIRPGINAWPAVAANWASDTGTRPRAAWCASAILLGAKFPRGRLAWRSSPQLKSHTAGFASSTTKSTPAQSGCNFSSRQRANTDSGMSAPKTTRCPDRNMPAFSAPIASRVLPRNFS